MRSFLIIPMAAFLTTGITAGPAFSAEPAAQTSPQSSVNGQVPYLSGGVGDNGMDAMNAAASSYNLKMLFVANGAYLADISVAITDSKGNTVLNTVSQGPVLLVKIPPGHYTVTTKTPENFTLTQHVKVNDNHLASYVLRYPATGLN